MINFNRVRSLSRFTDNCDAPDVIWALKDVSFEVSRGEVIGVIGRNGAGKSTLLKILSRITEPTKGRAVINGHVASLLEVGTGFHSELTGRENIYLNGTILGMTRKEVDRKFEEIVAFAEMEKFIDTPVKHYSSGMYVRLAFAVAAHLEPEILLVDEVLAVGDLAFQKKCLGKMGDIAAREGRTVLFVSHNMAAVQSLCTKIVQLEVGGVVGQGNVADQVELYLSRMGRNKKRDVNFPTPISRDIELATLGVSPNPVESGDQLNFWMTIRALQLARVESVVLLLHSYLDTRIAAIDLRQQQAYHLNSSDSLMLEGIIESLPLVDGEYRIHLFIKCNGVETHLWDVALITVACKPPKPGIVPYPAAARGILELHATLAVEYQTQGLQTSREKVASSS